MKLTFLCCIIFNALLFTHFSNASDSRKKPNIVLVFADDLGIEALNAYGGHGVNTPNLDKLAKDGMLFSPCFANPACTPSRAELLTGTYPNFIGFQHVLAKWEDDHFLDPKKFNTFANQLKKRAMRQQLLGSGTFPGWNETTRSRPWASMNIAYGRCSIKMEQRDPVFISPISA